MLPASAVPTIVGVLMLVNSVSVVITGAAGAVVGASAGREILKLEILVRSFSRSVFGSRRDPDLQIRISTRSGSADPDLENIRIS